MTGQTIERVRCQTCGRVVPITNRGYFHSHTRVVVAPGQPSYPEDMCPMDKGLKPDGS